MTAWRSGWPALVVSSLARFVLGAGALLVAVSVLPAVVGWQSTVVMSGSMAPTLSPGDVVVVRPTSHEFVAIPRDIASRSIAQLASLGVHIAITDVNDNAPVFASGTTASVQEGISTSAAAWSGRSISSPMSAPCSRPTPMARRSG